MRRMRTADDGGISERERLNYHDGTESALRPKLDPAIRRWRDAATELEALLADERKSIEGEQHQLDAVQARLEARSEEIAALADLLRGSDDFSKKFVKSEESSANAETLRKLDVSIRELATLSRLLRVAEGNARWLAEVTGVILSCPSWWRFMPMRWQAIRRSQRLRKKGLFDGRAYLARYPDVAQTGMDPLRHYIAHGQAEGRLR
jgi:hypothetical protein